MPRLHFKDYLQRGVTLTLFSITLYGAFVVGDGAYDILNRRYQRGNAAAKLKAEAESTTTK